MEGVQGLGGSPKFWRESKVLEESKYSGVYGNVFAEISDLEGSQDLEVDSMVFVGFQSLESQGVGRIF